MAEVAETYLHKGARIAVSATLDQNKWEGNDSIVRSSYQLVAHNIEFIKTDGRGFDGEDDAHAEGTNGATEGEEIPF